jgi:cytochrome oxidase assembly protein ShyY1
MNIMGLNIKELYNKYETIIKYSTYAFAGWFLSWVLFFIMLPGMIRYFGKVKGAFLNYAFSWISMVIIIIILTISLTDNNIISSLFEPK